MKKVLSFPIIISISLCLFACNDQISQRDTQVSEDKIRIGIITFLSGPAAGPFGIPAQNSAVLLLNALNQGGLVPGYENVGFGGKTLKFIYVDEAGGAKKVVENFRNLVIRQNVDLVIGVISSGDCLALAPVAEELKTLTILFDCATNRLFEENSYKYVFRTTTMATQENVAAARYVAEKFPDLSLYSGINPNYAWGKDAWLDFTESIKVLIPNAKIATNIEPKLLSGQYGTEISALLASKPDLIQNSLWGGDLEAYILQASPRALLKKIPNIMIAGETVLEKLSEQLVDGTIVGARGPNGPFAPNTKLNNWFKTSYTSEFDNTPVYSSYHMATAILGAKAAWEKAQEAFNGAQPTINEVIQAFEYLKFESVSGIVDMSLGRGHQAVQPVPYGTVRKVNGKVVISEIRSYEPALISPPDGIKSLEWIRSGFKNQIFNSN